MQPRYQPGDYVLICHASCCLSALKPGDSVVFEHPPYGVLIKQVATFDAAAGEITVTGLHPASIDSRQFGSVPTRNLLGKVVIHVPHN